MENCEVVEKRKRLILLIDEVASISTDLFSPGIGIALRMKGSPFISGMNFLKNLKSVMEEHDA